MDLKFLLNGKTPEEDPVKPHLGIIEGYIQEGINQVSIIELILACNKALTEEECGDYIGQSATFARTFARGVDVSSLLQSRRQFSVLI